MLQLLGICANGIIQTCDYHVKHSESNAGIGLFASRDVEPFEVLEKSIGVPIPIRSVLWNPLIYYVEGLNGSHALLALGAGMLLNHAPRHLANIRKVMLFNNGQWQFRDPYQRSIDFLHEYSGYVIENEEMLVDYGDDWFEDRGLKQSELGVISLSTPESRGNGIELDVHSEFGDDDLQQHRWQLATSCGDFWMQIDSSRNLVVSRRRIPAGTAIELSRALLVPVTDSLLSTGPLEEVLWWANTNPRTVQVLTEHPSSPYFVPEYGSMYGEYALLLSGKSALLTANFPSCDEAIDETKFEFHQSANIELRYQQSDCNNTMMVEAVAIDDISPGEILRIEACVQLPQRRKILRGLSLNNLANCLSVQS
jgi:hypothetical protein